MINTEQIQKLEQKARTAILSAYQQDADENQVHLYVEHHLEELEPDYWVNNLGTAIPQPVQVLNILEVSPYVDWMPEEDENYRIDFTLPEDVTQYVLCVELDRHETFVGILMES
ncbi:DUF2004 domain-containing protein [Acinetobacter sp. ANC 4648]|uniref:DUF2004 domain-containing protein n=1 Tax=Acinetobacter sp. ANC 4648 TaxID=1977875 RepID=UPI000A34A8D9|nr:DUF2004 domain-containing protein [Acinetobacter sp. ANC 4648]OTG83923.1 hypothetical protein B9T27_05340 [Acinetobacter sp. ANC 4648]